MQRWSSLAVQLIILKRNATESLEHQRNYYQPTNKQNGFKHKQTKRTTDLKNNKPNKKKKKKKKNRQKNALLAVKMQA